MPEPLLHLGDIGLVRAESLDVHPHALRIVLHHSVDPVRGDRSLQPSHCKPALNLLSCSCNETKGCNDVYEVERQ
jgi:hypothetical protein